MDTCACELTYILTFKAVKVILCQLRSHVWVENTAVTGTRVLSAIHAMETSYCSIWRGLSLTCHTPTTALAMRIRRITKGSTKAVIVSSPSSNQASTWGQSGGESVSVVDNNKDSDATVLLRNNMHASSPRLCDEWTNYMLLTFSLDMNDRTPHGVLMYLMCNCM